MNNLKTNIYSYLNYKNIDKSNEIDLLIEESLDEVKKLSRFKYVYQEFDYLLDFLHHESYINLLNGCKSYYLVGMTLGVDIEKRIKYYSHKDMSKMVIMDACASAYLEYLSDQYEKNISDDLTYRFCPGYQGTDFKDIKYIYDILKLNKIGIELLDSYLMIPQKTMVGIIGKGKKVKKNCGNCLMEGKCQYIKEGRKCYNSEKE